MLLCVLAPREVVQGDRGSSVRVFAALVLPLCLGIVFNETT